METFKVIEVKIAEYDGRMTYDNYKYVSDIGIDMVGNIVIFTSPNIMDAMKFSDGEDNVQTKLREQFINMVKTYFPKKNHQISYKLVTVTW